MYTGARWLGDGLLPSPDRVAAFVSSVQLDSRSAGSTERPFYRSPRTGLSELLRRLEGFAPSDQYKLHNYEYRFRSVQGTAYRRRVMEALLPSEDQIVDLPIRRGELRALLHMLEYAGAGSPASAGVEEFVAPFVADLTHRFGQGHGSAQEHREAGTHAHQVWQRMEEYRLRKKLEEE